MAVEVVDAGLSEVVRGCAQYGLDGVGIHLAAAGADHERSDAGDVGWSGARAEVEVEERFHADREALAAWAARWEGRVQPGRGRGGHGLALGLVRARRARLRCAAGRAGTGAGAARSPAGAKTDRLDARWLAELLARELLPESWIPPLEIQELRDRTRLRARGNHSSE
jgi:hypothetical protein